MLFPWKSGMACIACVLLSLLVTSVLVVRCVQCCFRSLVWSGVVLDVGGALVLWELGECDLIFGLLFSVIDLYSTTSTEYWKYPSQA